MKLDRSLDVLDKTARAAIQARLDRWLANRLDAHVPALPRLAALARDPCASPALRVVAGGLEAAGGMTPRPTLRAALDALAPPERKRLRLAGVTIGTLDVFVPALLKPGAAQWRRLLLGLRGAALAEPAVGATVLPRGAPGAVATAGFRPLGAQAVRIDLVERLARTAHEARAGRKPFVPDPVLATSMGLQEATIARLMGDLGFRPIKPAGWAWRGRAPVAVPAPPPIDDALIALTRWAAGG